MNKPILSNYLSLIKFSHTLFALPFAVIGFFLGTHISGIPFPKEKFLLVLFCMVFARSAAMAFNRYLDREFDGINPRTSEREIPAGIIKASSALTFVIINSLLFILTTWFINSICFTLSPIALLVILGYSYTKRFTALCHLVLGVGLSLAPIGAYIAVTGFFDIRPLLLSAAVFCWVSGFDIIYALQDEEFDKKNHLQSIPASIGKEKALKLSSFLHVFSAVFILVAGFASGFGIYYWVGSLIFISLLIYQHTLVKPDDLSKVNLAFFTTNGIGSVVFCVLTLCDLLL